MNGTSNVLTPKSYVIIHRMEVITNGDTSKNVGTITATAVSGGTVTARINVNAGQTQMAIYGVPSVHTVFLGQIYASMNKAVGAGGANVGYVDISLEVNSQPDVELTNFAVKHTFGLSLNGTSLHSHPYYVPKIVAGPAIIKMQCTSGTANMDISAGFDANTVDTALIRT